MEIRGLKWVKFHRKSKNMGQGGWLHGAVLGSRTSDLHQHCDLEEERPYMEHQQEVWIYINFNDRDVKCVLCVCVVSVSEQWHIWRPQGASVHIRHLHEVLRTRARITRSFEGPENLGKYTRKEEGGRAAAIGNLTRISELPFYYMQNHTWHHIIYTLSRFQQILLSYIRT